MRVPGPRIPCWSMRGVVVVASIVRPPGPSSTTAGAPSASCDRDRGARLSGWDGEACRLDAPRASEAEAIEV